MDSTNSPNPAADILAALIELELASADATRRIADEAARIIMRDVTDQIGEAIDTMSRLGQTDLVEGAMTTKTLTLPEIAKTWSDRLVRLDGDDIRRLVSDGGILVGADGDQARTDGDAVATVWLRLEDSRIVVCGDADADDWHEADVELPSTISRVWHLGDLREQMGSEATIEDADEMRDLLADAGWLHWTSDADGGLMIDIPEDEWLALLEVACARAAEIDGPTWVRWEQPHGWFSCLRDPDRRGWTMCGRLVDEGITVPGPDDEVGEPARCGDCPEHGQPNR